MSIALGAIKISNISAAGAVNISDLSINTSDSIMYMSAGAGSFNSGDLNLINNPLNKISQHLVVNDFITTKESV